MKSGYIYSITKTVGFIVTLVSLSHLIYASNQNILQCHLVNHKHSHCEIAIFDLKEEHMIDFFHTVLYNI